MPLGIARPRPAAGGHAVHRLWGVPEAHLVRTITLFAGEIGNQAGVCEKKAGHPPLARTWGLTASEADHATAQVMHSTKEGVAQPAARKSLDGRQLGATGKKANAAAPGATSLL